MRSCSFDTELIDGNKCAKNQCDGFVAAIEIFGRLSFFLYPANLLSKALDPRNIGCPFSAKLIVISSARRSHSPSSLHVWIPYHFVSDPDRRNDQWPCPNLFAILVSKEFEMHKSSFPYCLTIWCHCTLTLRWFFLGIAQVYTVFQSSCSGSRRESAMWWIPGKFYTLIPSAPRRFDPTLDIEVN